MLARKLPPGQEALDFESSSSSRPVRYGRIVPLGMDWQYLSSELARVFGLSTLTRPLHYRYLGLLYA
jgi:hypothetical protein